MPLKELNDATKTHYHPLRRRPDYAPAHYILAIALGFLGQLDAARAALAVCEANSPGFVRSRRNWQPYADPASNQRLSQELSRIEEPVDH